MYRVKERHKMYIMEQENLPNFAQSMSGNKIKITTADGSVEYRITLNGNRLIINAVAVDGDAQMIAVSSGVSFNELNIFPVDTKTFYS